MSNNGLLRITWPPGGLLSRQHGLSHRMETLDEDVVVLVDAVEHLVADPGHDPHADGHVGGVGQFDAVLGQGAADRAHAEWDHVHGAA